MSIVNDDDPTGCPGHYEHNYRLVDERDGFSTYICQRCGAEIQEEAEWPHGTKEEMTTLRDEVNQVRRSVK